jgi:ribosome recycling factor
MNYDLTLAKEAFVDAEAYLKQEYLQISTGRANPALLDGLSIDSYGSQQPIKNVASITIEDARSMKITPWDKNHIASIEKSIYDSKLPFSVSVDDTGVRVNIPQLTEESKREIVKMLKEKLENARVKVRNIRQDTMKEIEQGEKDGLYAEDARKRSEEELQKLVDASNKNLEDIFKAKEESVMSV